MSVLRRILLVKTSSLGDVVHNLPVVSDIVRVFPEVELDWLVERSFAAIPRLHPGVQRVHTCQLRRWRRGLFRRQTWDEIRALRQSLGDAPYDAVIDSQGLLKSALVGRLAQGVHHGLDWRSSREPLRWLYDQVHAVLWGRHAVVRNRELAAKSLGYALPPTLDYGIRAPAFPPAPEDDDSPVDAERPWLGAGERHGWVPAGPFAVLLHATSADTKLWPEHQWKKLIAQLIGEGLGVVLPWGSPAEEERAKSIAAGMRAAVVPPRLGLRTLAGLLGRAEFCVGVDTGLTHFAAALGRPTVGIYVATNPEATGVLAPENGVNVGAIGSPPSLVDVLNALKRVR
jgi:heptosyltransferase-1